MSRLVLAGVLAALALAAAAGASTGTTLTIPLTTTTTPLGSQVPQATEGEVTALFLQNPKVVSWLRRYPPNPQVSATFANGSWTVNVSSGKAGEIATGKVDDASPAVTEAWTGPQVAWKMARGYRGAFGGAKINSYSVWLGFCAVFLIGLIDWRRPLSVRNVDLLVLVSLSVSLWYFNRGNVFAAVPLMYPPVVWLLARCLWIARRDVGSPGGPVWPVWVLAAATVFIAGFRIGLNVRASNVIDVGYSGVIGADLIAHGQSPYGHFPVEGTRPACGPADADGEIRNRIQTNGRCETADAEGDTYGPVAYIAYLPGYWIFGWSGKWDSLPAVHFTSILFDTIALLGLALVGRRFGGPRLAATLAFAWVAWPFTQYASSSNTNDAIGPALLVWGFLLLTSNAVRGFAVALSGWTKFAPLLLLPLWSGYPEARRGRSAIRYALWFLLATALVFFVLFLEPSPIHAARVFVDRTVRFQIGRDSPFSLWDWGQYHARGLPNLSIVQHVLQAVLVIGALALGWWPKHRSPLRMAALTSAVLIGFELVLTHWSYLYLPWFYPFVALALIAPLHGRERPAPSPLDDAGAEALAA